MARRTAYLTLAGAAVLAAGGFSAWQLWDSTRGAEIATSLPRCTTTIPAVTPDDPKSEVLRVRRGTQRTFGDAQLALYAVGHQGDAPALQVSASRGGKVKTCSMHQGDSIDLFSQGTLTAVTIDSHIDWTFWSQEEAVPGDDSLVEVRFTPVS